MAFIIPCFNEAKTIKLVLNILTNKGDIYLIDNGSTDNTLDYVKKFKINIIKNKFNFGYDTAIEQGMRMASKEKYRYLITVDADGEHNLADFDKIISNLKNGYDLVLTNRNTKSRIMEYFFSLIMKQQYKISDPLSGIKGYRTKLYDKFGFKKNYNSVGTYLMINAIKNNYKFTEINYNISKRNDFSRFGNSLKVNLKILYIILISQIILYK